MKKLLLKGALILLIIAIVAGLGFLVWNFFQSRNTQIPGITEEQANKKKQEENQKERAEKQEVLIETVKEIFAQDSPGTTFSIAVYDLKRNEYFGFNDTDAQHAASISKILTAVYSFDQVEKSNVSLSDPLGAYNIETQIKFLINQSSQDSWDLLDERFKLAEQNKFAKSLGLNATDVTRGVNKMSPKDTATLLKKLQKGEILKQFNRDKLFSYMQKTESEDFFSPALKLEDARFYHKTGKYLGEGHDAAVVEHDSNPFVLVVFSNNNTNTNLIGRGKVMTQVASEVYGYFDSLN